VEVGVGDSETPFPLVGALVDTKGLGVRDDETDGGATVEEGEGVGPAVLEGVEPGV